MRPKNINDLQVMWAIRDIPDFLISFEERSVLVFLVLIIGNHDYCYYSQPELAKKFSLPCRSLQRYLSKLEKTFITIERSKGRSGNNKYYLDYDAIMFCGNSANLALLKIKHATMASFKEDIAPIWRVNNATVAYAYNEEDIHKEIHKKQESNLPVDNFKSKSVIQSGEYIPNITPEQRAKNAVHAAEIMKKFCFKRSADD